MSLGVHVMTMVLPAVVHTTIPTTALAGNTRMRISAKYRSSRLCDTGFDGEVVEDYTINIIASNHNGHYFTNFLLCRSFSKHTTTTGTYNTGNIFYRPVI
jgi:hypothetical protein